MGYPMYGMPGMGGMYGAPQFIPPPLMAVPSFPGYVGDMSHFYGQIPAGLESVKQQNACKKPASGMLPEVREKVVTFVNCRSQVAASASLS